MSARTWVHRGLRITKSQPLLPWSRRDGRFCSQCSQTICFHTTSLARRSPEAEYLHDFTWKVQFPDGGTRQPVVVYAKRRSSESCASAPHDAAASRPLSTPEGVQSVFSSHVDFPVGNGWRGQNLAVEPVSGQDLQLRTGIQYNHHALLRRNVDLVVGGDW